MVAKRLAILLTQHLLARATVDHRRRLSRAAAPWTNHRPTSFVRPPPPRGRPRPVASGVRIDAAARRPRSPRNERPAVRRRDGRSGRRFATIGRPGDGDGLETDEGRGGGGPTIERPEENPTANPNVASLSGVRYASVLAGLNELYPPDDLEDRNAASRADGYWPYVNDGRDPPAELTYGEFDFYFFAELLDRALPLLARRRRRRGDGTEGDAEEGRVERGGTAPDGPGGKVFADIGSGAGRLVLGAAALHPEFALCRGLELLRGIHDVAVGKLESCERRPTTPDDRFEGSGGDDVGSAAAGGDDGDGNDDDSTTPVDDGARPIVEFSDGGWSAAVAADDDVDWLDELSRKLTTEKETAPAVTTGIGGADDDDDDDVDKDTSESDGPRRYLSVPEGSDDESPSDRKNGEQLLPLAPIEFTRGSFDDPYVYIGDVDVAFVFSSCMSPEALTRLSRAIGRQCKPGTIVITTEFSLPLEGSVEGTEDDDRLPSGPYELELLERIDGWCWLVGGTSTAYVHRVVKSLWKEGVGKMERPEIPLEEQAWRIVQARERGELTDTGKFLREVHNNMVFHGLPWRPQLSDD